MGSRSRFMQSTRTPWSRRVNGGWKHERFNIRELQLLSELHGPAYMRQSP